MKFDGKIGGGYTFQIFRNTGYGALAALDVATNGEVRDLSDLGIVGIKMTATGQEYPPSYLWQWAIALRW